MDKDYIKTQAIVLEHIVYGVCRQVIKEFSNEDTRIIVARNEKDYKIYNIEELLPHGFSGDDVNV